MSLTGAIIPRCFPCEYCHTALDAATPAPACPNCRAVYRFDSLVRRFVVARARRRGLLFASYGFYLGATLLLVIRVVPPRYAAASLGVGLVVRLWDCIRLGAISSSLGVFKFSQPTTYRALDPFRFQWAVAVEAIGTLVVWAPIIAAFLGAFRAA